MRALAALVIALAAVSPARAASSPILQPCSVGGYAARCGTVVVPENRLAANSRTIGLRVDVLPADGKPVRSDPLFYIVGGPGGVATESLPSIANVFAPINEHRDIVFVDQRGVGGSNPLTCALPADNFAGTVEDFVTGCVASTGADVTRYRTPDAIDDLESVRIALGYGKIDIYGGSYGGTVVQMYLAQHPQQLRTAIMDSTSWLDVPVLERWGSSAQRALDLIHRRCLEDGDCRKAFPRWYQSFKPLLWKLSHGTMIHTKIGNVPITIDAMTAADVVEDMTTKAQGAAEVPYTLAQAEAGKYTPLARQIAMRLSNDTTVQVMPYAIMCTEPWAAHDPAKIWADVKSTYMRYSSWTPAWVSTAQICAAMPKATPDPEELVRPHSLLPVLDLVGQADPKDPAWNTPDFLTAMPNGKEIVVPDQGHGAAYAGCMPDLVDRFLEAGTVKGLDTSCVRLIEAPAFRLR
jgi:pimeloyl-ACP methyl ester carboxylesterase